MTQRSTEQAGSAAYFTPRTFLRRTTVGILLHFPHANKSRELHPHSLHATTTPHKTARGARATGAAEIRHESHTVLKPAEELQCTN